MLKEDENEFLIQMNEEYDYWNKKGFFDAVLPTISTKQASANILRMYGLGFRLEFPFNNNYKNKQ